MMCRSGSCAPHRRGASPGRGRRASPRDGRSPTGGRACPAGNARGLVSGELKAQATRHRDGGELEEADRGVPRPGGITAGEAACPDAGPGRCELRLHPRLRRRWDVLSDVGRCRAVEDRSAGALARPRLFERERYPRGGGRPRAAAIQLLAAKTLQSRPCRWSRCGELVGGPTKRDFDQPIRQRSAHGRRTAGGDPAQADRSWLKYSRLAGTPRRRP